MFFSTDLLQYKRGIFHRIWLLGSSDRAKIKKIDLTCKLSPVADAISDWINRTDYRRLSLYLSATMALGLAISVREQIKKLLRDIETNGTARKKPVEPELDIDLLYKSIDDVTQLDLDPVDSINLKDGSLESELVQGNDEHLMIEPRFHPRPTTLFDSQEDDNFGEPLDIQHPNTFLDFMDEPALANAVAKEYDGTIGQGDCPEVEPVAPARSSCPPPNGNKDAPPPAFPDMDGIQDRVPEQPMELEQPFQTEQPVDNEPPYEPERTNEAEQPLEVEQPMELEPSVPTEGESMNLQPLSQRPPKSGMVRRRKRKNPFADGKVQIDKDKMRDYMSNNEDILTKFEPAPIFGEHKAPKQLFDNFGIRSCMSSVLKTTLLDAAHDEKFDDEGPEEEPRNEALEYESFQESSTIVRGASLGQSNLTEIAHQSDIMLPPESPPKEVSLDPIAEGTHELSIRNVNSLAEAIPREERSYFGHDDVMSHIESSNSQDLGRIFREDMQLCSRRDVAKAFEIVLVLEGKRKIKCVQEEFMGRIMVKKAA